MTSSFRNRYRRTFGPVVAIAFAAALVCGGSGCASPAEQKRGTANKAWKNFAKSLDTFDGRVQASVRAMDRLESPNTFDLQAAYMDFMAEYFNVSADAGAVAEQAEVMRESGVDYFLTAHKEAKAEDDRKVGEQKSAELTQREAATREAYDALQNRLSTLRDQYRVYRGQLNGLYKHLNRNATRERITAAAPQFAAARKQADVVLKEIAATNAQSDKLSAVAKLAGDK